jgi:hypothetical protein
LDLSRRKIDVCLLSEHTEVAKEFASPLPRGWAPVAGKTDKTDAPLLALLSCRRSAPDPKVRRERELARVRMDPVRHRSMLKHRIQATMISLGIRAR